MWKKIVFYSVLVSMLTACNNEQGFTGELITDGIEYNVEIGDPTEEVYDFKWISKGDRQEMVMDLMQKAKNYELPIYDFFPDTLIPLSKEKVDRIFRRTDTMFVENENEQTEAVPIVEELDLTGITKFKFKEKWYYDKEKAIFSKKVIAICPLEKVFTEDGEGVKGYKGLFWIYLN